MNKLSACCNSEMYVSSGDEGTNCYMCKKCKKACDPCLMATSLTTEEISAKPNKFIFVRTPKGKSFVEEWIRTNKELKLTMPKRSWFRNLFRI